MEQGSPRLPSEGEFVRSHGVLLSIKKTQPPIPKPIIEYIFEELSARKELRYKDGSVLKELETLNDFYGRGTGEQTAINELEEYCKNKGIDGNSDIEAFVVREIDHIAKKPLNRENFYNKEFYDFETTVRNVRHEEIDVWSSKQGRISQN